MKKFLLLSAIVMFFGVTSEAFAQGGRGNNRGDRRRIQRGIRSGQITRAEAQELRLRQRANRAERRGYRSDGTLTRDERRDIRRDEREHDRLIREARRDDDRRPGSYNRRNQRRGDGYYRRGAGSPTHPVFGNQSRKHKNKRNR